MAALMVVMFAGQAGAAESGFAGLQIQPADHAARHALGVGGQSGGVLVRDIAPGGPGEAAGLERGDLLLSYEGVGVAGLSQLVAFMQGTKPNTTVSFEVHRQGQRREVSLPLAAWPVGWDMSKASTAIAPAFGTTTTALTADVRESLGVRWGRVGVSVAKVNAGSPAANGGLRAADLLLAIGRTVVIDPAQVEPLVAEAGEQWMALVERDAAVLLLGPGAPPPGDVVVGPGVLAAALADGPYVMDVSVEGPDAATGDRLPSMPTAVSRPEAAEKVLAQAGLRVATLSDEARAKWPVRWSAQGVVVIAVEPATRASMAGLRPGHVIRSLNQNPVQGLEDLAVLDDPSGTVLVLAEDLSGFTLLTVEPRGGLPKAAPAARPALQWGVPKGE
ncbi:MAG: PDZ domain-containing protein [Rhodospirillaceae bacterium]